MGRYDLRPQRVYQTATQLLTTQRLQKQPAWFDTVGSNPPPQILVRTQPVNHGSLKPKSRKQVRKPSKLFQPKSIQYPEDKLRKEFFTDHPWELARPRVVLENDGQDFKQQDWSSIIQPNRLLDGESVVQRQLFLMTDRQTTLPDGTVQTIEALSKAEAYDQARQEFYAHRMQEDVERRIAKEEAWATGAYFGKSTLQVGMELEDKSHQKWKAWAEKTLTEAEQARALVYTGLNDKTAESTTDSLTDLRELEEPATV